VQYRTNLNGTKTYELVTGLICNRAITCECCGDKISIWNFEKHLASNRGQPCDHITIPKNSTSTLTCIIDCIVLSWDNPEEQNRHSITWAGRVTYGIETSQMSSMARNSKKKVSFHKLCKSNLHPYMKHYFKITFTKEAWSTLIEKAICSVHEVREGQVVIYRSLMINWQSFKYRILMDISNHDYKNKKIKNYDIDFYENTTLIKWG